MKVPEGRHPAEWERGTLSPTLGPSGDLDLE